MHEGPLVEPVAPHRGKPGSLVVPAVRMTMNVHTVESFGCGKPGLVADAVDVYRVANPDHRFAEFLKEDLLPTDTRPVQLGEEGEPQ